MVKPLLPNIASALIFRILLLGLSNFSFSIVYAQSFVGVGYGTFNVPGASTKFKGFGPTVKFEQIAANQRVSVYFDLSYFNKKQNGSSSLYDNSGNYIGTADTETVFSYLYSQSGMKVLFFGDANEKKILPYLGAGVALVYSRTETSYESTISTVDEDQFNRFIFGFHFNAGLQYYFRPVILELRGNFDIDIKPLVNDGGSDVSNILTNLRLSVLIPLSK